MNRPANMKWMGNMDQDREAKQSSQTLKHKSLEEGVILHPLKSNVSAMRLQKKMYLYIIKLLPIYYDIVNRIE